MWGFTTPREAIGTEDFQMIDRLHVKGRQYLYILPTFIVSRKALHLLLDNAPGDLRPKGVYFKKSFVPVVFD
jgi:hypothetical protein